jgi:glutamine amidotransferase
VPDLDDSPIRDESNDETPIVAILDYISAQSNELAEAISATGADVYVTSNWAMCSSADGLIVPNHDSVFDVARELNLVRGAELIDARLIANKSVLAIGSAFNLLFELDENAQVNNEKFQQWPGMAKAHLDQITVGWQKVNADANSKLFVNIHEQEFFFDNKLSVSQWVLDAQGPLTAPKVSWVKQGDGYVAAVENGPLIATQFLPEKSKIAGHTFLKNWVTSL